MATPAKDTKDTERRLDLSLDDLVKESRTSKRGGRGRGLRAGGRGRGRGARVGAGSRGGSRIGTRVGGSRLSTKTTGRFASARTRTNAGRSSGRNTPSNPKAEAFKKSVLGISRSSTLRKRTAASSAATAIRNRTRLSAASLSSSAKRSLNRPVRNPRLLEDRIDRALESKPERQGQIRNRPFRGRGGFGSRGSRGGFNNRGPARTFRSERNERIERTDRNDRINNRNDRSDRNDRSSDVDRSMKIKIVNNRANRVSTPRNQPIRNAQKELIRYEVNRSSKEAREQSINKRRNVEFGATRPADNDRKSFSSLNDRFSSQDNDSDDNNDRVSRNNNNNNNNKNFKGSGKRRFGNNNRNRDDSDEDSGSFRSGGGGGSNPLLRVTKSAW